MTLSLLDIILRDSPPIPYADGEKIPWDDPAFSARMLKEHLSQEHNAASRRQPIIDQHVDWIHDIILRGTQSHVLDLCCGPGFYTNRLAEKGHRRTGIDFSPASIDYAKQHATATCQYVQGDIRTVDYGTHFDLVMMIFGEFNTFRKHDAQTILQKAYNALKPDGTILFEPHTFDVVQQLGEASQHWYSQESGLFSENPHIALMDSYWHADEAITTQRYYIVDAETGSVTRWASSMQAYTHDDYRTLLTDIGFRDVQFYDTFGNAPVHEGLLVVKAQKQT